MLNVKRDNNNFKNLFENVDGMVNPEHNEDSRIEITENDFKFIELAMSQELIVVLAKNKYLQGFINDKFNSDYSRYYECYVKSGKDAFCNRKEMLDIASQDAFNKLLGILIADGDKFEGFSENDYRIDLIKRGYRDIYRQVKSMQQFDIFKVFEKHGKKLKKNKFTKRELADIAIIAYAVAVSADLSINPISCKYLSMCCQVSLDAEMVYDKIYLEDGKKNRLFDIIPNDLLDNKKYVLLKDVISKISSDAINDAIMADAMEYYAAYMQSIGLDIESFTEDLPYTREDINVLTTFLNNDNSYILTDDSKKAIFSALLMLLAFKKRYDEAKNIVLNKNAESRFKDALEYKEKIRKKEEELDEKIESYSNEINSLKKELDARDKEILELKNQIKKQQDIINKSKDNSNELLSLRKAIYSINNAVDVDLNNETDLDTQIESMKDMIKKEKIVIFGGGPKWVNMLKEELPFYTYFSADDINRDISCIKKCKAVYINTQVLSHAFYYKIIAEASKNNVSIEYITKTDKVSIVKQIFNDLNGCNS